MTYGILQARSGTAAEWASLNPVLEAGEIGHVAPDSPGGPYSLKIGDGVSTWNDLPTISGSGGGGGGGAVESVNGKVGVVTLTASDVGAKAAAWEPDLSGLILSSAIGAPGGVASLDGSGLVPSSQLPGGGDYVPVSTKGQPNGVASLNGSGIVPTGQLPNFVLTSTKGQPNGVASLNGEGIVPIAQLPARLAQGDEVTLTDSSEPLLTVHIPNDGSPTGDWPDRFVFYFEDGTPGGRRTGYFNEYGEMRARPAKHNTIAFRAMPHPMSAVSQEVFQVSGQFLDTFFAVSQEYINLYLPMRHAPSDTPLANVIVLDDGEPIPGGTPEGTVVVVRPL